MAAHDVVIHWPGRFRAQVTNAVTKTGLRMKKIETELPDVYMIEPDVYEDSRGFFLESWNHATYRASGMPNSDFVQHNHSRSRSGVLRGLHYQLNHPQAKLVQVVRGAVFDVAVDIRLGSPTFGQWVGHEISDANHRQLWVPAGYAHGFLVISDWADFTYQCSDFYHPEDDHGIVWNDVEIGITWPNAAPRLSEKDRRLPTLSAARESGLLPRFDER
jgi:dTDP-4-dehydrorhamnose 3,5-epimerase